MKLDTEHLEQWIDHTQTESERLDRWPVSGLMAALDMPPEQWPDEGDPLPATAHWNYFVPRARQSKIASDGHPEKGDFLPPVPLPRRMWAGSRIRYEAPMPIGAQVTRTARIKTVTTKEGRSGLLAFVTVENTYVCDGQTALIEEQDLVYRDNPPADAPAPTPRPAPDNPQWSQPIHTDEALLFRFSAVTFNAHRIHYDQPYVTHEEGYPGLIVHGQLVATFLLQAWQAANPGRTIKRFDFKAMSPVFCGTSLLAEGRHDEEPGRSHLWARATDGGLHLQADVTWE
jgi:3-methylfumaryl-CoA hydratase